MNKGSNSSHHVIVTKLAMANKKWTPSNLSASSNSKIASKCCNVPKLVFLQAYVKLPTN